MPLLLTDFEFRRDIEFKTAKKDIADYIRKIDPYFDMRRLGTFFGNKSYYVNGYWHAVGIPQNSSDIIEQAGHRYLTDTAIIKVAESLGLIFPVPTYVARADQVNAVAQARGLDLSVPASVENYAVNWKGFIHQAIIKRQCLWEGPGINKPLTAYDLTYWIRIWSNDPSISEDEVIAAMDIPTIRTKLNWDMGSGVAWKGIRLLNAGDLSWYTGAFPDKLAMNDGKSPPPPGEDYGYGYVDMTEVKTVRDQIIGDKE